MSRSSLEGVAALTKQLEALGKLEDGKALRSAVKAGIKPALERAKELIPVGTEIHRLKTSKNVHKRGIKGMTVGPGFAKAALRTISTINAAKNIASGLLSVRKAAYYAVQFVEFGTRKMAAEPWLRRAFSETRDAQEEAFRASIQASVLKAAKTP